MIELIPDLPSTVAAFRASGKVTRADYDNVVIPHVDFVFKTYGKISFLLWLDTDVSNYTLGAWMDDAWVGLKHITHWHKIAIVSHQDIIKNLSNILGHLIPGETKGFKNTELANAKIWVSEH